ncbi:MAG TPA: EAL domain-containing protein [Devosiaceae bacterium]|jgi:diguanylate cyclase (GGDEF)-like protein/PAS domain S-box-containing protein
MVDDHVAMDAESILRAALEPAPDAAVIFDSSGTVRFVNGAATSLWGRPRTVLEGSNIRDLIGRPIGPEQMPLRIGVPLNDDLTVRCRLTVGLVGSVADGLRVAHLAVEGGDRQSAVLARLVADTDRGILVTDGEGKTIYGNRAFFTMLGYSPEEVLGRKPADILGSPSYDEEAIAVLRDKVRAGESFQEELVGTTKAGMRMWLAASIIPVIDGNGRLENLYIALADITESKQLQALQRDVLEAVAHDMPLTEVMHLLCDRVETIAPDVVCTIVSVDADRKLRPLAAPSMPRAYDEAIDGLVIGPKCGSCGTAAYYGRSVVVRDIANDPLWEDYRQLPLPLGLRACWSSPLKLRDGRVAGTFAFYYREVRGPSAWHEHIVSACIHLCVLALERHEAKAHIAKLAYFDMLTGLPNRAMLREQIGTQFIATAEQRQAAFLFLDIDHFKDVNDTLGHSVGDQLLVDIAHRLQRQLRADDTVSRLGGDEFVIVLADSDAARAEQVAGQILECLREPVAVGGVALPVSASIGISLYPADGCDEDTLLRHADTAMYQAKSDGRGRFRFFATQMNQLVQDRLVLGAALRQAIEQDELMLYYQPQICTESGGLHGVEALARWTHPRFGIISPDRFVALAEECGLIDALGEWALNKACRQVREWTDRGFFIPNIAVNLSPLHFRNPALGEVVRRALADNNLPATALTVEITESVMVDDAPEARRNAEAIHADGVRLSIDDFGTGYSSLSHLSRLPVSELKIDRSFMHDLEGDEHAQALVTAVIRIGQSLGLTVVAEGVECEAQRRFLEALDCDVMQGFLFARPMPVTELERWVIAHNRRLDPTPSRDVA